jgi:regulation of enolase protein 1 (concanavalin A-like superfamily)
LARQPWRGGVLCVLAAVGVLSSAPADAAQGDTREWKEVNVGPRGHGASRDAGSAPVRGPEGALDGTGRGIRARSDAFRFRYAEIDGDFDLRVRLQLVSGNPAMQAGLMMRDSLDGSAPLASLVYSPIEGLVFLTRDEAGANVATVAQIGSTPPAYLRLSRQDGVVEAWYSSNGSAWTSLASVPLPLASTLAAGLMVSNASNGVEGSARFAQFLLTDGEPSEVPDDAAMPTLPSRDLAVTASSAGLTATAPTPAPTPAPSPTPLPLVSIAFTPSADHATLVKSYRLEVRRATDALSSQALATLDLGKPPIVSKTIQADISTAWYALTAGSYKLVVLAVGSAGSSPSQAILVSR